MKLKRAFPIVLISKPGRKRKSKKKRESKKKYELNGEKIPELPPVGSEISFSDGSVWIVAKRENGVLTIVRGGKKYNLSVGVALALIDRGSIKANTQGRN